MDSRALGLVGVGAVFIAVAAYVYYTSIFEVAKWLPAKATVSQTTFEGYVTPGPRNIAIYRIEIKYAYMYENKKFNGQFLESNGYSETVKKQYETSLKNEPTLAKRLDEDSQYLLRKELVEKYPKESEIEILINPKNPQESRIKEFYTQNQNMVPLLLGGLGIILFALGAVILTR